MNISGGTTEPPESNLKFDMNSNTVADSDTFKIQHYSNHITTANNILSHYWLLKTLFSVKGSLFPLVYLWQSVRGSHRITNTKWCVSQNQVLHLKLMHVWLVSVSQQSTVCSWNDRGCHVWGCSPRSAAYGWRIRPAPALSPWWDPAGKNTCDYIWQPK